MVAELSGVDVEICSDEQRLRPADSEVERLLADISLAKDLMGWQPEFAGREELKEGLRRTAEWFSNPDNLRRYRIDDYVI